MNQVLLERLEEAQQLAEEEEAEETSEELRIIIEDYEMGIYNR